jgi:hypothetical protein
MFVFSSSSEFVVARMVGGEQETSCLSPLGQDPVTLPRIRRHRAGGCSVLWGNMHDTALGGSDIVRRGYLCCGV